MTRLCLAIALALSACAAPIEQSDAAPDASSRPDAQSDAQRDAALDTGAAVDTGVIVDTGVAPIDTGVIEDTGVAPRDTGVGDTGLPACTLDPRNCGQCGRVCSGGQPLCAEVSSDAWGCVNNCAGFGTSCIAPSGGGEICCASGLCGPGRVGCR